MPGRFHTAIFDIYSDESRAEMSAWLTEQSAQGWEPISVSVVTSKRNQVPQAFVVVRHEAASP